MIYWAERWYHMQPDCGRSAQPLEFIGGRGATPRSLKMLLATVWPKHYQPTHVVVHVGTNNLGRLPCRSQREELESLWEFLPCLSETTEFIWSDMLPKSSLRHAGDLTAQQIRGMERARRDINRFARRLSVRTGGRFIKHPDIKLSDKHLFRPDGIHLSAAGLELLIRDFCNGPSFRQHGCADLVA